MGYRELTEKDLGLEEKKVFGRIIDLWAVGDPEDPYINCTEARLIKRSQEDGLSEERVKKVLKGLEGKGLIQRVEESGASIFKYKAGAAHIVRELQKTDYVHEARDFKPHHHGP